jgi:hypothetical protein
LAVIEVVSDRGIFCGKGRVAINEMKNKIIRMDLRLDPPFLSKQIDRGLV